MTGVQTCALPIWGEAENRCTTGEDGGDGAADDGDEDGGGGRWGEREIGRASCRERV